MGLGKPTRYRNILIISHDVVGSHMAGPGIRYFHLAQVLCTEFNVFLAVPAGSTLESPQPFSIVTYQSTDDAKLKTTAQNAHVVLVAAIWMAHMPYLLESGASIVIDGYDPYISETLSFNNGNLSEIQTRLTQAYLNGDFFICASERQRDWWLGLLETHGRINPYTYNEDPSLRRLLDVVPYGLPKTSPKHTRTILKGVWPGINGADKVILWGGGLWPWLDPHTAIRAIAHVWQQDKTVRLIFPGTHHPNPGMVHMPTHTNSALRLAQDLGILNKAVFFGDWIPYNDWPNVLLECDLALALHLDTIETRLAFRSRVLEYIWAGLPIVATKGDATSDLINHYGLGRVVGYQNTEEVVQSILTLLDKPKISFNAQFNEARKNMTWEEAAKPLINFCRHPRQTPDKTATTYKIENPFYQQQLDQKQALINAYEQGRFIKLMRWFHHLTKRRKFR